MSKYEGVDTETLRNRLGRQCSPMRDRKGYVIGPNIHGRISHCSTHFTLHEAKEYAKLLNEKDR